MEVAEGVVFRIHTKDYRGKNLYSVKLDGTPDDEWYRLGEDRREGVVEEGFKIKIGYELDRRDNRQVKKVKVLKKGEPVKSAPKSSGGSRSSGTKAAPVDWDAKDANIQYQSARKDALMFLQLLIDGEIVKLPPKTKADERLAALEGYLDIYTARFFADIASKGAVGRTEDEFDSPTSVDTGSAKKAEKYSVDDFEDDSAEDDGDEW